METLFTPWRYAYIAQGAAADSAASCFFCAAAREPDHEGSLVVHVGAHHLVMLNLHPYTNGHLMVAPLAHVAAPAQADAASRAELWPLVLLAQRVLARAFDPHGFNLGMNLGRAAGAGVPGHYHFHVVPRWEGDTNFMSAVGGVRIIPDDLRATRERLRTIFAEEA